MESLQTTDFDDDIVRIKIIGHLDIQFILTKYFTLNMLKDLIVDKTGISYDDLQLDLIDTGIKIENKDSDHLTLEQLNIQDGAQISIPSRPRYGGFDRSRLGRGMKDIGVFDENHAQSHGREILKNEKLKINQTEVDRVID